MDKRRLDAEMARRALADSREQAKRFIMAGEVLVNGHRADKPSMQVVETDDIRVKSQGSRFVSRGGIKLERALQVFSIDVSGMAAADIGASTGGFTDCMLQYGARKVYAVDVGYGQLDYRLRIHPDVVVMERTNARFLKPDMFEEPLDFITMDVSFISVRLILPAVYACMRQGAQAVVLVKPQFEAGREHIGKNGVVRDSRIHEAVLCETIDQARKNGFFVQGLDYSPIRGPEGNIEFLLYLAKDLSEIAVDVGQVVSLAHTQLH